MAERRSIGKQSRENVDLIRPAVFLRDDYRCVVSMTSVGAESPCEGPITIGHRVGRGMGGSALFDGPAFLITQCLRHNVLETSSATFAAQCREFGWSLPRLDIDVQPESVPVLFWDGWYELDPEFCARYRISTDDAEARIRAFQRQPLVDSKTAGGEGRG